MGYQDIYSAWQKDPEGFWMQAAEAISWVEPPKKALFDRGDGLFDTIEDDLTMHGLTVIHRFNKENA